MTRSYPSRILATLALLPLVPLAGGAALAHVTLEQREAAPGASYKAVFKIPHGCDGSATQAVRVEIPEGFFNVKPMPKPGWTLDTVNGAYASSYSLHGRTLTEGVKEIKWSGGDLPDAHYDEFVAAGFLAKDLAPGSALYFKVTQTCAEGEIAWTQFPDGSDQRLASPAAVLKIADAGGAPQGAAADKGGSGKIGSLAIEGGWVRATPEAAKVGAGYLTIRNTGPEADTLVSVAAPVAGKSEIHDMTTTEDGVMKMRALPEGIEIPAGGSVELKPGGTHLMFMDLEGPLAAGASVPVTLTFKSGASGEVTLPVKPLGGGKSKDDAHDHGGHGHGGHDHHHHH